MKILLSLEHTVAGDILNILRRLPFQPHFLMDFEMQLEKMVADPVEAPAAAKPAVTEAPAAPAAPAAPVVADPVADPAPAAPVVIEDSAK